jgi:hypothetical protein
MPRTSVSNETKELLGLWVEPWGLDYWLRPGERFTIVVEESAEPVDEVFETHVHDQGVSVYATVANSAEVIDSAGNVLECGHQRPADAF